MKTLEETRIPPIVCELGQSWAIDYQPSPKNVLVDDKYAVMYKGGFDKLLDYSHSQPTALYNGKMWKGKYSGKWYLFFCSDEDEKTNSISVNNREILIVN